MVHNTNTSQPKNSALLKPLARSIPEYRQARLSGKKYVGPMLNINPFWHNSQEIVTPTFNNDDRATVRGHISIEQKPKENVKQKIENQVAINEIEDYVFSDEESKLSQILAQKEFELKSIKEKTALQKDELAILSNHSRASKATIRNLRQQLGNMERTDVNPIAMEDVTYKLQQKEAESKELDSQIETLQNTVNSEQQLEQEIAAYRSQVRELKTQQERLQQLVTKEEQQLKALATRLREQSRDNKSKEGKIKELEKLLDETMNEAFTQPKVVDKFVKAAQGNAPEKVVPLTKEPNSINGIVKDNENKLIANAVVIIKDIAGHNLRALQTNQLGQFLVTTSLQNGTYYIEATKSGYTFPVIQVELTGKQVAPVVLTADELTT